MLDLGCQAGHGPYRNVSDALLWLDHFHAPGSLVVGVDVWLDYALDLQHRFDHVPPYDAMASVEKRTVHAAVGSAWSCDNASTIGDAAAASAAASAAAAAARSGACTERFNFDLMAAYTHLYCSRTDWKEHFTLIERHGVTDHSCRITRQRAGISASTLPLPPSPHAFNTYTDGLANGELPPGAQRYRVPTTSLERLWRGELRGRRIDFLKADVDVGWHRLGEQLAPLVASRAFALLVMEIDLMDNPLWRTVEQFSCLMHEYGYSVLLKMPCAAWPDWSQRARYVPISGEQHQLFPNGWGRSRGSMDCGPNCMVQDLIAVDAASGWAPELVALGDAECAAMAAASASGAPPRTPMEAELPPAWLKQPTPEVAPRARCLPDGSWSCGRPNRQGAARGMPCTDPRWDPRNTTCKALWT